MRNSHMEISRWQYLRMSTEATLETHGMGGWSKAGEHLCILRVSAASAANIFGLPHFWWLSCCSRRCITPDWSTRTLPDGDRVSTSRPHHER
jgi:hypothetical protein